MIRTTKFNIRSANNEDRRLIGLVIDDYSRTISKGDFVDLIRLPDHSEFISAEVTGIVHRILTNGDAFPITCWLELQAEEFDMLRKYVEVRMSSERPLINWSLWMKGN
ncbi:MAG: hypothetical protein HY225_03575 [Candidatus Vogelbacteria bacterium]|nr:hypothetical protein [Candidatus Vogelbacteria bacterium]